MAERVGVSNKVLSFYEQGRHTPDAAFIARFAEVNQCSADYLLGLSDVKTQKTDLRAICRQTGLSEKAVQKISACCARRYLNRLLEEESTSDALANTLESLHTANRRLPFFDVDHFMRDGGSCKRADSGRNTICFPLPTGWICFDTTSRSQETSF